MGFRSPEQRRAVMAALRAQDGADTGALVAHTWRDANTIGEIQGRYRDMREIVGRLDSPEQLRRLRRSGEYMAVHLKNPAPGGLTNLGPRGARVARREQARLAGDIERRLRKIEGKATMPQGMMGPNKYALDEARRQGRGDMLAGHLQRTHPRTWGDEMVAAYREGFKSAGGS